MAENREHQLVEGDAVMRVSGGGHFKQKSIKSKFVSISLRDKLIFLFVGTLFVELLLFGCVMSFYLYINAKKNVSDNIDTTVTAVSEIDPNLFQNTTLSRSGMYYHFTPMTITFCLFYSFNRKPNCLSHLILNQINTKS